MPSDRSLPNLHLDSLYFSYRPRERPPYWAIANCSLALNRSGHVGIIGGNGSRKNHPF